MPNSVKTIGEQAFISCSGLTSITSPYPTARRVSEGVRSTIATA
jgi:hypothetical protein